ncbi:bromodomain-containing protein 7-like, partial [Ascaphus truei]|uniref:bromodomain-containing protein 7-like n=1 Tax=Ascaphus truei TaxID=8439 RepID=UPI003F592B4E
SVWPPEVGSDTYLYFRAPPPSDSAPRGRKGVRHLTRRVAAAGSELEFERRKPDGTTTLGLLNPPTDAHPGEMGYSHTHLGLAASRLQAGVNSLHGFKEDKRNKVTPVLYLNYGPFSSYAPAYDSTFANISKDDSDLIYTTYGDEPSAQGAFSIQEFLESTQDPPYGMADCILDAVTNGEYSRSQRVLDMAAESGCTSKLDYNSTADQLACLKSVFGLGIFEETFDSAEAGAFQRKLDETTSLLRELQDVQSKRLSTKPPPNAVCLLAPSAQELQLSEKVNGNLKELAQQVNPGDIVSVQGVRKAMGISAPPPGSGQALVDLTAAWDWPRAQIPAVLIVAAGGPIVLSSADTQEKGAIPGSGECVVVGT